MPEAAANAPPDGILAGSAPLERWLHISLVVLVLASAVRYLQGHGLAEQAPLVLLGAGVLLVVYVGGVRTGRGGSAWWLAVLVACWVVLAVVAPSFSWVAVPLVFVALRVLPYRWAVAVTVLLVVVVVAAWSRMTDRADPTVLVGPVSVAVLAVTAYRALERDAVERRRLLAELQEAQDDIAVVERRAGVLAERARLSREIHDSVAQGLTSINLLLQAAEQDWDDRAEAARERVQQASAVARDSLDEARRVVRDLAPGELDGSDGSALVAAVRDLATDSARAAGQSLTVHVHGDPGPVSTTVATAVLRTVRGSLANVFEHARAETVTVTLTFQETAVMLDVRDDGIGFDPRRVLTRGDAGLRGHGLPGLRDRVRDLGGDLDVESAPDEGAVVVASFPREGAS